MEKITFIEWYIKEEKKSMKDLTEKVSDLIIMNAFFSLLKNDEESIKNLIKMTIKKRKRKASMSGEIKENDTFLTEDNEETVEKILEAFKKEFL
jgi:formate-dependent nitrite reductase cytochrome c552 subunit